MDTIWIWLTGGLVIVALAVLVGCLGLGVGRKAAKAAPGLALGLWLFASYFRLTPPPPPQAERALKDEDDAAGAPP